MHATMPSARWWSLSNPTGCMVRREDDRAAALRAAGAEVVVLVRNLIAALVRAEEVP